MGIDSEAVRIGRRLRAARTDSGLTQDDAAVRVGLARTSLVAIEQGQRAAKPAELQRLAEVFAVSLNRLLGADTVHLDLVPRYRRIGTDDEEALIGVRALNRLA